MHSDLTTLVQIADLIAYIINWGVRFKEMNAPYRPEIKNYFEAQLKGMRFKAIRDGEEIYGYKAINNLGEDTQ